MRKSMKLHDATIHRSSWTLPSSSALAQRLELQRETVKMSYSLGEQLHQHQTSSPHSNLPGSLSLGSSASEKRCTQACFLLEEQNARELQKLRDSYVALKLETDKEIAFLKQQLARQPFDVSNKDHSAGSKVPPFTSPPYQASTETTASSPHTLVPTVYSITDSGVKPSGRINRLGSIKSAQVLASLRPCPIPATGEVAVARRVLAALADPMMATRPYLRSLQFAADLVELSVQVGAILESEARCLDLPSPVYVFGDVHGNWTDLRFFAENIWHLGLELTAGSFLFLGDYVDRGSSSLECIAYLFAHKLLYPGKIFLLRGNHETRAVNGLEAHYGSGCLLAQCKTRFGTSEGSVIWHQINNSFDRLPVAAVIDSDIFCVHGGIPRPIEENEDLLETIAKLPTAASLDTLDVAFYADNPQLSMIADMIWGDPVRNEGSMERASNWRLDSRGFGKSPRGGVAVRFGSRAVDKFLGQYGFSRILRAHEAALAGLSFSNSARVITVFSTSKDHGLGDDASCGCVLVDNQHLRFFNRARNAGKNRRQLLIRRHSGSRTNGTSWISRLSSGLSPSNFPGSLYRQRGGQDGDGGDTDDEDDQSVVHYSADALRISSLDHDRLTTYEFDQSGAQSHENNNQVDDD
ncbi:Metallo-dependent phosphatase-like [Phytophthora cactorum]|nr:Metallo-dependent phosphatase-like [Phytophthora cactorum]